jgi:hypothetical protein
VSATAAAEVQPAEAASASPSAAALIVPACGYSPAALGKALEALILKKLFRYPHPTHPHRWNKCKTPAWVSKKCGHGCLPDEVSDRPAFVHLLLKAGADADWEGGRLVVLALQHEREDVFNAILETGPVPSVVRDGRALKAARSAACTSVNLWLSVFSQTDPACVDSGEVLSAACYLPPSNISVVHTLLRRGADVNYKDGAPLRAAMLCTRAHTAALLLLHGADVKDSQVEKLYSMTTEEEGGPELGRALEVRGIHPNPAPPSTDGGAGSKSP